jgi:hypothetical protein
MLMWFVILIFLSQSAYAQSDWHERCDYIKGQWDCAGHIEGPVSWGNNQ